MAYQKIYSREHWENFPSESTAINATRLNNIESGIDAIDDRVCALDTTKVDLTKANELVKEILWDESNGTLTVVKMNGSQAVIDTKLEKLAVNFAYNPQTQQLVITLFQYIPCYGLSYSRGTSRTPERYFNTSHVTVYPCRKLF